jgi:hypothetical protein
MSATPIYVKTPKGLEEINSRSFGLPPRTRQLLILLDGKRSSSDIAQMLPEGESEALLTNLVADGFVVPLQQAPAEVPSANSAARIERPQNDAERFEMAKNFMRNTVHTFLGGMGSGFISQVEKCTSIDELHGHSESWQEALLLSRDGRNQLVDLEKRLAALLS